MKHLFRTASIAGIAASTVISGAPFLSAGDFQPRGGFLVGRLAMKKLKKMREQDDFSGHDTNKDGGLDKKEIEGAKEKHGNFIDEETFKKIDKNGDGKISHEECEEYDKELEKAEGREEPKDKKDAGEKEPSPPIKD